MTEWRADIEGWCRDLGFRCRVGGDLNLHVQLDDQVDDEVSVVLPEDGAPLRLEDRVLVAAAADLRPARLADVVEDVALARPGLVDARPGPDGAAIDVVILLYSEGLNRHTFAEATFELQKVRHQLRRQIEAAVAAEETVRALEALATHSWTPVAEG
jgi:hypothetical protein